MRLARIVMLPALLLLGGCPENPTEEPEGDEPTPAGPVASRLGVAAFGVSGDADERLLTLYDESEAELGVVAVTSDDEGLVTAFTAPGATEPSGTLRAVFHAPGPEGPVQLVLDLEIADVEQPLTLTVRLLGGADPADADESDWVDSILLETPVAASASPPGVGRLRLTEGGLLSVLPTVDHDASATTAHEMGSWFVQTGLVGLADTSVDEYLLAALFDLAALQEPDGAGSPGVNREPLAGCRDGGAEAFHALAIFHECTGFNADDLECTAGGRVCVAWHRDSTADDECLRWEKLETYFEAFTHTGCIGHHVRCLYAPVHFVRCVRQVEREDDLAAYCSEQRGRCFGPMRLVPNASLTGCECGCADESCAAYCQDLAMANGLTSSIPAACSDALTCDCGFDAEAFCASQLPDSHCGGGEYDDAAGGFHCPSAACGDGVFMPTCAGVPTAAEVCDDSSLDGQDCGEGYECVGCGCLLCEISVECGDGRVSRACPGLVEECDGVGQAQCPEGFRCEDCGCVEVELTCQDETASEITDAGTRRWEPPGEQCGLECPPSIETTTGTWSDCLGPRARPGCPEVESNNRDVIFSPTFGYVIQSCQYYAPGYDRDCGEPGCGNANLHTYTAEFSPSWFDLGRDPPSAELVADDSELRAVRDENCIIDQPEAYGIRLNLFSTTHWATVCYRAPLALGDEASLALAEEWLRRAELLAWER